MKEVIMIKYAELTTKKDNRNFFINTLEKNVLSCLDGLNPTIKKDYYRMFIYVSDIESSISKLSKVFGIHEIVRCVFTEDASLENIENISKTLIKEGSAFKVILIEVIKRIQLIVWSYLVWLVLIYLKMFLT